MNAPRMFSILIHLFLFVFPPRCELSSRLRIHVTEFPQQVRESRSQTRRAGGPQLSPRLLSADGGKAGGEAASRPRLRQPQFTLRVTYTCLPGFFVGTKRIRVGLNVSNRGINSSEKIQKRVRGSRSREMDLSLHRLAGPVTARRGVSAVTMTPGDHRGETTPGRAGSHAPGQDAWLPFTLSVLTAAAV